LLAFPTRRDNSRTLGQRLCYVLGRFTPHGSTNPQRFIVDPLIGFAIKRSWCLSNRKVSNRVPRCGKPQFRVTCQVAYHSDIWFSGHEALLCSSRLVVLKLRG